MARKRIEATATGYANTYLPAGPARDDVMALIRLGQRFRMQHVGRRPGALFHAVLACVRCSKQQPVTFAALLTALEVEAGRRSSSGPESSAIEKVDRIFEVVTYHDNGRRQATFKSLSNHLGKAKKCINAGVPLSPNAGKAPRTMRTPGLFQATTEE